MVQKSDDTSRMIHKDYFTNSRGLRLAAVHREEDNSQNTVAILVHGFGASKDGDTVSGLDAKLKESGIPSLRFDTTGVGESEGEFADTTLQTYIDDVKQAMEYARQLGYSSHALMGASVGGLAAIHAGGPDEGTRVLVLDSAIIDLRKTIERTYSDSIEDMALSGGAEFYHPEKGSMYVKRDIYDTCVGMDALSPAEKFKGIPSLVVHGDKDLGVPFDEVLQLKRALGPNTTLEHIKGAGHLFNKENGEYERAIRLMAQYIVDNVSH